MIQRILAVAALALFGSACGPDQSPSETERASLTDYQNARGVGFCLSGLQQAAARGDADPARASMIVPWQISTLDRVEGLARISCLVSANDRPATVVVDVMCGDPDNAGCGKLVSFRFNSGLGG